ncbi:hypothetical protein AM593_00306, partial [Mytilus galloprovincialis]
MDHAKVLGTIRQLNSVINNQKTFWKDQALKTALQATKCSNDLPATGDDFDYYSSYQGVREVLDIEGNRILNM